MVVHYVVRGEVEIIRHGKSVRTMGPRTVVGGIAALAEDEMSYDCIARQDTVTLEVSNDDGQEIFEDHFWYLKRALEGTGGEVLEARRQLGPSAGFGEVGPALICPDRPLDLVEKMAVLRKMMSFADSQIDAIADLAREAQEVRYKEGEVLWEVGDKGGYFLMPLCGAVTCSAQDPEQEFRLGPGDSIGLLDAVSGEPRWFRAVADEDIVAFRIGTEEMFDVLEDHFGMAMSMLRGMATGMLRMYDLKAGVSVDSD